MEKEGDTPYTELYDGSTWRITNGNKRKVGLMTSARLGALMTNAGRTADGEKLDPTCTCCKNNHDTARHVLLGCKAMEIPRNRMWRQVMEIWDNDQQEEFANMSEQQQYMTLLGKQMEREMDIQQQTQLDTAVKKALVRMDNIRMVEFGLQPMNGRTHNRPPEQSIQLTEQWREMTEEWAELRAQQLISGSDDEFPELPENLEELEPLSSEEDEDSEDEDE